MGPAARAPDADDKSYGIKNDRKIRKPLVEKRRRARINDSLQELRMLLADGELSAKVENAEVLEMTVKRVEQILQSRSQEAEEESRATSERFAAGYIQCMHEVHSFLSTCPGLDAHAAPGLLRHLLECMPLAGTLADALVDALTDTTHEEQITDTLTDTTHEEQITDTLTDTTHEEQLTDTTHEEQLTDALTDATHEEQLTDATHEGQITDTLTDATHEGQITDAPADATPAHEGQITDAPADGTPAHEGQIKDTPPAPRVASEPQDANRETPATAGMWRPW